MASFFCFDRFLIGRTLRYPSVDDLKEDGRQEKTSNPGLCTVGTNIPEEPRDSRLKRPTVLDIVHTVSGMAALTNCPKRASGELKMANPERWRYKPTKDSKQLITQKAVRSCRCGRTSRFVSLQVCCSVSEGHYCACLAHERKHSGPPFSTVQGCCW